MRIHTEVRGDQRKSYWGRVFYRLVCPETGESVDAGVASNVSLRPFVHNPEQKTAAKIDVSRLKPGCRYEVHVEIEQGNGRREIWTNDSPRAQLMMVKSDENPSPDTPVQPIVPPTPQPPVVPVVPRRTGRTGFDETHGASGRNLQPKGKCLAGHGQSAVDLAVERAGHCRHAGRWQFQSLAKG